MLSGKMFCSKGLLCKLLNRWLLLQNKYATKFQQGKYISTKQTHLYRNYCSVNVEEKFEVSKPDFMEDFRSEDVETLLANSAKFEDAKPKSLHDVWTSVYPVARIPKRKSLKLIEKVDPKETTVILFPGQGTQLKKVRKLLKYKNVEEMFNIANQILEYDLLEFCLSGPKSDLEKSLYDQAAVFVTSLATIEKLKEENPQAIESCVSTAGFDVGEYASLVFAKALSFEDALKLINIRAKAMQEVSEQIPSGMIKIFYYASADIRFICEAAVKWCTRKKVRHPVCRVANYLYPHCKVLAGNKEGLQFIELNAKELGIKRLEYLPANGAFHTKIMTSVEYVVQEVLNKTILSSPLIFVHSNINGKVYQDAEHIRTQLAKLITQPIMWEQVLHFIYKRPRKIAFPMSFTCGLDPYLRYVLKMVNLRAWRKTSFIKV